MSARRCARVSRGTAAPRTTTPATPRSCGSTWTTRARRLRLLKRAPSSAFRRQHGYQAVSPEPTQRELNYARYALTSAWAGDASVAELQEAIEERFRSGRAAQPELLFNSIRPDGSGDGQLGPDTVQAVNAVLKAAGRPAVGMDDLRDPDVRNEIYYEVLLKNRDWEKQRSLQRNARP